MYPEDGVWGISKNYVLDIYNVSGRYTDDASNLAPLDTDRYLDTTKLYLKDENGDGKLSIDEVFGEVIKALKDAKDVYDVYKSWEEYLAATYLLAHGIHSALNIITVTGAQHTISCISMPIIIPKSFVYFVSPYGVNINDNYNIMGYSTLDRSMVSVMCPVNATITDQYGRIISDDGTNEIPNANLLIIDETKIFCLPADLTYSVDIDAYDTGTFNLTRVSPVGNDITITKFENIPVTSSTKASLEVVPSVTNYTMSIDYDGDGVTDEEKSPDVNEAIAVTPPEENIFDTGAPSNPYPSIAGTHTGTITPNRTITVNKLYTYPCAGTGGHTESIELYDENGNLIASGNWNGYQQGDWHNITFNNPVVLLPNKTYNYTIRTGSYPQIHHNRSLLTPNGWINCSEFVDANGKVYYNWIPAIKLS